MALDSSLLFISKHIPSPNDILTSVKPNPSRGRQLSKLELQSVPESDRAEEDITELPELSEDELRQLDDEAVKYTLTMQEEELSRLKPDLAALAEYRKKVREGTGQTKT